jgi:hypothetical protein
MNISLAQKIIGSLLRWLPFLLYASWVFVGYRILLENQVPRPIQFRYIATGFLPTNHLLRAEDFLADGSLPARDRIWLPRSSELEGKYVARTIRRGQDVDLSNLRSNPVIVPSSTHVAYVFSLQHQASLAGVLNAGATIRICTASCDETNIRVLALLCSASKKDDCSAILDLPPAKAALFVDPAKVQLFLK